MTRTAQWWLLLALLLAIDVVTVVFDLFSPPLLWLLLGLSGVLVAVFLLVRVLDLRMQRDHERAARDVLARYRQSS